MADTPDSLADAGPVRLAREGAVAVVTLDEPAKKNALTLALRRALLDTLRDLAVDPACRAVVLTGAGGAFCSGGDLSTMRPDDPMGGRARMALLHDVVRLIAAGPKPVVAAVEGPAYGAGMGLAAAADVVVAASDARFCASFARVGLVPDGGLLWSLPARVGMGAAKRMLLEAAVVPAEEAKACGLADELAAPGEALAAALARARALAAMAPMSTALTKAALARGGDLESALTAEIDGQPLLFTTADHREGVAAFMEKRAPVFKGG